MERLRQLVGKERSLNEVSQALHFFATHLGAVTAGALHVTCSDETEQECAEALQWGFVRYLLPPLKFARRSPFRISNLGGRYEWGAVRLAEAHFAAAQSGGGFKLLLVKVNAHVAFEEAPGAAHAAGLAEERPFRLGIWRRYGEDSPCCGALQSLLEGGRGPFLEELREAFVSEGRDRLATLAGLDPAHRPLAAALVSARLQARKAVLDIQDYRPVGPTFFLVIPCVTVNRHQRDTEILCGLYVIDGREGGRDATWFGLGDDPAAYAIGFHNGRFTVTDEELGQERQGRDHRALVEEEWQSRRGGRPLEIRDERLTRLRREAADAGRRRGYAKSVLRMALPVLAEVAPVPAAILMFAEGVAGIHHVFRVHQLARGLAGSEEARRILDDIRAELDQLDPDRAEALLELLTTEVGG